MVTTHDIRINIITLDTDSQHITVDGAAFDIPNADITDRKALMDAVILNLSALVRQSFALPESQRQVDRLLAQLNAKP